MTEEFEVKEKTKITALKWDELTEAEQVLVMQKNAPLLNEFTKKFYTQLISMPPYYFDRLGNIYTHFE